VISLLGLTSEFLPTRSSRFRSIADKLLRLLLAILPTIYLLSDENGALVYANFMLMFYYFVQILNLVAKGIVSLLLLLPLLLLLLLLLLFFLFVIVVVVAVVVYSALPIFIYRCL
jgi:hypothetical protein